MTALVTAALVTTAMAAPFVATTGMPTAAGVSRRDRVTTATVGKTGMATARITAAPGTRVTAMEAVPAIAAPPAIAAAPRISAPVITWTVPAALIPTIVTTAEREKLAQDEIEPQARERRRRFLRDGRLSHGAAGQ